jgi:hypothetical protein
LKRVTIKTHIIIALILLINFISTQAFKFGLNYNILLVSKSILYISGSYLYFIYRKPFTEISFYFSLYIFTPIVIAVSWITVFLGIFLTSIFIMFFIPKSTVCQKDNYTIYKYFSGFLTVSRKYEITENKYFIFEKTVANFENEELNLTESKIRATKDTIYLKVEFDDYDYQTDIKTKKDTLIKIKKDNTAANSGLARFGF